MYGYGVLGGVLAGLARGSGDQVRADAAYVAHRARRDTLTTLIAHLGTRPVAAEPAYATPFQVVSLADCRRLARLVEHRCAAVFAFAVSQTVEEARVLSADALTDCAVREVGWGADPEPLPGLEG